MTLQHEPHPAPPPSSAAVEPPVHSGVVRNLGRSILTHLRDPMRRSSYALILGTGLTSALGLVFWALAARWLSPAAVGVGASLVTVMIFLANLSTLGLRNGLVRFLPAAGAASRRLVLTAYAVCAGAAAVVALVFLAGRPIWASRLELLADPLAAAAFVAATMIWVLFVLQDHVLVGLRNTGWVPLANGLCSVLKIALLPVLAGLAGWAIFAATVLPAAVAVIGMTVIVWRLSGRRADEASREPISVPRLIRFAVTDHLTSLLWMSATNIMMLLVLQQAGPEASAYFFLATTIGYTLYLIVSNVGSALVAESARFPERAVELSRQALLNAARLVLPLAVVGAVLAPLVLSLLGQSYADNATGLLQLVLASAVPQLIIGISLSTARVRNDLKTIVLVYAAIAVGDLGGTWLGLHLGGLTGVGIALLITETTVAVGLLLSGRTGLWADQRGKRSIPELVLGLGSVRRQLRSRREAHRRLAPALAAIDRSTTPGPYRVLTSDSDTVVVLAEGLDPQVIKIATSPAASRGLQRHLETLQRLAERPELAALAPRLPRVLGVGIVDGQRVSAESWLPGIVSTGPSRELSVAAAAALSELHLRTGQRRTIDQTLLHEWIDEPVARLRGLPALASRRTSLERLAATLQAELIGAKVVTSQTHGDFWPGNVLAVADPEGPTGPVVSGILDWENARDNGLPDADLLHWWLTTQPAELGSTVGTALAAPDQVGAALADLGTRRLNPQLAIETLVLLTWLWHVSDGVARASRNSLGRVWLRRNVLPVIDRFRAGSPATVRGRRS